MDSLLPVETASSSETRSVGSQIAARLRSGDVLGLYGALGAGKTELVRGICSGLGVDDHDVNSPTFTIVNEYRTGRLPVYHFDAYRIRAVDEFYDLGYEDYFFDDGVTVVEWADKVEELLPPYTLRIRLRHGDSRKRLIELITP